MIKVKIGVLIGSQQSGALSRFANATLPSNTAFRLRETLEDIQKELESYDTDRLAVLAKHTPLNDDGTPKVKEDGSADLTPEQMMAFQDEVGAIMHREVELRGSIIRRSGLMSSTAISANDLMILSWLIPGEEWPEQIEKAEAAEA